MWRLAAGVRHRGALGPGCGRDYAVGAPLGARIVSHAAWDVWIFLVQPAGEIEVLAAA